MVLDEDGDEILDYPISDYLRAGFDEAMAQMTRGRFRHLPVLDKGELVGLVSIGDLVKHRLREMELETGVLRDLVIAKS